MLEIIFWSTIILGGSIVYGALGGECTKTEHVQKKNPKGNHYKDTYEYFSKLSLDEQHKYINDNLDLREWKSDLIYDNKQSTARQVARRAEKLDKTFNNRHKTY